MSTTKDDAAVIGTADHNEVALDTHHQAISQVTPRMIFFVIWIALAGWMSNFDIGYSGTVLAMAPYNSAFGDTCSIVKGHRVCKLSATQQSLGALYVIFLGVGAGLSSIITHYLGRRSTIQVGCLVIIIGAASIQGTAGNYAGFLVCKSIGGIGLGINAAMAPIYGVECTPPQKRGLLMASYGIGLSVGLMCVAAVCIGSATLTTNWAWKTPIIIQIPLALIYGVGILMFPESPRWLLIKGREGQARRAFGKFYSLDPASEQVTVQIQEVQRGIEFDNAMASTQSWTEIFHPTYLIRTFTSAAVIAGSALSGIWFVAPYAALFLADLGIKNHFLINFYFSLCTVGGTLVGPFLAEYAGRRLTMATGYGIMASCMLIVGAVGSGLALTNPVVPRILVAFFCIWAFTFGATNSSCVWTSSAEIHSVRLRTYGQTFSTLVAYIFVFGCSFWTPYMLSASYGDMGTSVGYFYFGTALFFCVFVLFFVPETARLTLEQIDEHFASGRRAWKTSLSRNKRLAADGLGSTLLEKTHEEPL